MSKLLAVISVLSILLTTSGCGGLNMHTKAHTWKSKLTYDPEKLTYDAKRRVWFYDKGALLLNGKKIADKELAVEMLQVFQQMPETFSTVHTASSVTQGVIILPFVSAGVLLASPVIGIADTTERRDSFKRYVSGEKLLAEGQYSAARQKFHEALHFHPILAPGSDLLFKLAVSYDGEGKIELAKVFYREFLECSVDLYPQNFEDYDKTYINDPERLNQEFTKAEEKIGVKSAPTVTKSM